MKEELFEKYLLDTLSDGERVELTRLLKDEAAAREFVAYLQEWSLMADLSRQVAAVEGEPAATASSRGATTRISLRLYRPTAPGSRVWWAAGAAAAILFAVGIVIASRPSAPRPEGTTAAGHSGAPAPAVPPARPAPEAAPHAAPLPELPRRVVPPTFPEPPLQPPPAPQPAAPLPAEPVRPAPPPPAPPSPQPPRPTLVAKAEVAELERVQGDVQLVETEGNKRSPARGGLRILVDQGLSVGRQGWASVKYPDETRVDLGPEARVSAFTVQADSGKGIVLAQGTLSAVVTKQPRPFVVVTPHAEAVVLGTSLELAVGSDSTRLVVRQGRVRLTKREDKDRSSVEVAAGQMAVAQHGHRLEARLIPLEISFQDGVSPDPRYGLTADTQISEEEPARTFGTQASLEADGDETGGKALFSLVRWELAQHIPQQAIVLEACITLHVTNDSDDKGYFLYEVKRPWAEQEATWTRPWRTPGARGREDRGSEVLAAVAPSQKGEVRIMLLEPGKAVVQGWVRNPRSNAGFLIANEANSDGFKFDSREYKDPSRRPRLTVRYTLAAPK
jgi:ferric-dicitrate binding protein FerR (iron transport regulator)